MNRKQSRLAVVALLAVATTLCVACGQPSSQKAADEVATPATSQPPVPTQAPPPQEQPPAVAQLPSQGREPAATQSPAQQREPARRKEPTASVASVRKEEPPSVAEVAPAPQPIVKTVPAGTAIELIVLDGLSSQTSQAGDTFRARVARDVTHDGLVVIPAGSVVHGSVTEAVPLKKIGGTAKLSLVFSKIDLTTGSSVAIEASLAQQGKSETKKDAATIGGAAAGGALLGKLLGHGGKGALIGAVVGGAAGTAVAAKTKGEQVEIPVGTEMTIDLNRPVDVTVRP